MGVQASGEGGGGGREKDRKRETREQGHGKARLQSHELRIQISHRPSRARMHIKSDIYIILHSHARVHNSP